MSLHYFEKDGKEYVSAGPPGTPLCDFCSVPHPVKVYEAKDAEVVEGHVSEGAWAACKACAQLIDANDREGLLQRAIIMFAGRIDVPLDQETIDSLRMVQSAFFDLRI